MLKIKGYAEIYVKMSETSRMHAVVKLTIPRKHFKKSHYQVTEILYLYPDHFMHVNYLEAGTLIKKENIKKFLNGKEIAKYLI